jgi:hypothetical protein
MKLLTLAVAAMAMMSVKAHACGASSDGTLLTAQTRDHACRFLPDAGKTAPATSAPARKAKAADGVKK